MAGPLPLNPGAGLSPGDFQVTCFATNVFFPYGMAVLPDQSLLVASSRPRSETNHFFSSHGELLRLTDRNGDGVADEPWQRLATDLPGTLIDVRTVDSLVVAVSAEFGNEQILFFRLGAAPGFELQSLGRIRVKFPWVYHQVYALILRPLPPEPPATNRQYEVFFNVGSLNNQALTKDPIATEGLFVGELLGESIYRMVLDDIGTSVAVTDMRRVASGVRNAAGMVFSPDGRELWFSENGIDGADGHAFSADEFNVLPLSPPAPGVTDYGYPSNYVAAADGMVVGTNGVPPRTVFRELEGQGESEGPTQVALAPTNFPAPYGRGVFLGFHGKYDQVGDRNDENALVWYDPVSQERRHFVLAGQASVGHLDGLLSTGDSLYVSDLTGVGSMFESQPTGVIYRVRPSVRPPCLEVTGPSLRVQLLASPGRFTLSWTGPAPGKPSTNQTCLIEAATNLGGGGWKKIAEEARWIEGQWQLEQAAEGEYRYYRLRCGQCPP